ncbi:hypothetical protein LTR37_017204 [Vermiconidia calcicola]|uniref:Uncharacterized protein n=1 Tax=Vermiconidia calcicola TaxID=1690605 RepID=A0ACC3MLT8_9PEZI|nr:hypothetical protein LTR37_017204 [Vermiconidia calcicola]
MVLHTILKPRKEHISAMVWTMPQQEAPEEASEASDSDGNNDNDRVQGDHYSENDPLCDEEQDEEPELYSSTKQPWPGLGLTVESMPSASASQPNTNFSFDDTFAQMS